MSSVTNGEKDGDCLFLERVLDKLYDFGNGPPSKKTLESDKKKKRKRFEEEEEKLPTVRDTCGHSEDCRAQQNTDRVQKQQQTGPAIQQVNQVEVVTFQDPTKNLKTEQKPTPDKISIMAKKESDQIEELNLEKARLEIHRFGITGYKKEQQRVFEQDRAIMLGARPPKKEYVNYRVLQQQIKEKKEKVKEEVHPDLKKKKKQNNKRDKNKKKLPSGSGSAPSGQVGRFKNGMLILNSKEIQKIKSSHGRK